MKSLRIVYLLVGEERSSIDHKSRVWNRSDINEVILESDRKSKKENRKELKLTLEVAPWFLYLLSFSMDLSFIHFISDIIVILYLFTIKLTQYWYSFVS